MKEKNIKQKLQFLTCPECVGKGVGKKGYVCKKCSGLGLGSFFYGRFLYWGIYINKSVISFRKLKRILNIIIDISAFIVSFGGLISLAYWMISNGQEKDINLLMFWQYKSNYILFFWIGMLVFLFFIYRIIKRKEAAQKIKKFHAKNIDTPNNWEGLGRFRGTIDVSAGYKGKTLRVIEDAYLLAFNLRDTAVTPLHLFYSLAVSNKIRFLFNRLNVNIQDVLGKVRKRLEEGEKELKKEGDLKISNNLQKILIEGFSEAYDLGQKHVHSLNLILLCIQKDDFLKEVLLDLKIDENKVKNTIEWFRINRKQLENYQTYKKIARFKPKTNMDRAYTAVATPLLNNFAYDLTLAAKWGRLDLCVAREEEIEEILNSFISGAKGVLLTGPNGVGKKTVVSGIAKEMVLEKNIPDFLKDKRLLELDIARLISGISASEAEDRLLTIIDEIHRAGNIILYIENLENIIGITAGAEQSLELSDVLAGELERGALFCISTATDVNYNKYIEGSSIGNVLNRIKINEPEGNQAIHILESKIGYIESKHNVFFSYKAIESAMLLTKKFIHDKYLPVKAIEVLEKTAVRVNNENNSKRRQMCDRNDVAITINQITDIPTQELEEDESEKLLNLEKEIHKYMINQNEAVDVVANSLRRARVDLREGKRPIASFLFMGPTGVGKTELAKTITRVYFEKKEYMIRLDMSEYQHEDSIKKMIGDSEGAKGYLTEAVRHQPYSLILLDEFEKAHPKIFNLFLQVMDDGRLTDGQGVTIDFTNSIIIATSNAGSNYIQQEVSKNTPIEDIKRVLINEHLNKVMRPELINRFDGLIVFKPLSRNNIMDITRLMLSKIENLLKEKGINIESTEEGIAKLADEGYDPKFGARPLRRLLRKKVENEIAKKILAGELDRRDTVIINEDVSISIVKGEEL